MAIQLGKRYECEVCGTQALATKASDGALHCCEKEMALQGQRRVPSAD
ncbi:MAG: desulfoferrodoxin [Chloroflexi bacterium]|nr:desulfoferrodoxin [Chloroflexota bacterium]